METFMELILSFHCDVGSRDQSLLIRPVRQIFSLLSQPLGTLSPCVHLSPPPIPHIKDRGSQMLVSSSTSEAPGGWP